MATAGHGSRSHIEEYGQYQAASDTAVVDSAVFYERISRKSVPKRCGPASLLDLDEAGVTDRSCSQTFKIVRCCVRKRMVTSPGARLGGKDSEELRCERGNADGPLDAQAPLSRVVPVC